MNQKINVIIKRSFDILASALGLIILSPLLLILAVLVRLNLGSPVFFRQERPGLHEKIFNLYKFRSMRDAVDKNGNELPDEQRLSKFGKLLRASSLDELPELFNVLKGDMSLVGPRPLLVKYLQLYNAEQHRRHDVLPGITGWAQVHGRNAISWEEKFRLDVWYVDNWSLWLDLKILFMTVKKVFIHEGISAENQATTEEFHGNRG
ncbi:MAG: sugar transferase [Anaerolineaceae bacterium]|nr:sugar transferase [Anaerolineaceae bacterium]